MNRPSRRLLVAAFLLPLLFVPGPAAAAPPARGGISPDAAPLVARHVAWLGGAEALAALRDLTLEGTLSAAGLSGALRVAARRDGRQRSEYDLKVVRGVETLAGDDGWERNASGQVEPMGREKAVRGRRALDRAFGRHLLGEGVSVSRAPDAERGGRSWAVLRFAYPDGDLYDLLVDPESGATTYSRSVTDGRATWTKLSDLRVVSGLRLAFRQETEGETPLQSQQVTWEKAVANAGLADALFARPESRASLVAWPAGRGATEWTPVELYRNRYVYLRGEVNGVPTDIVLDSGAGMTVVDRALAAKLNLRVEGELEARGTGGNVGAGLVSGLTVQVAGTRIGPLSAAVIDLEGVGRRLGRPLPLILGKELFHAAVVDLDYPGARLRLLDAASFRYEGPGRKLDLVPAEDGHRSVRLSVEGSAPALVGLDTGQGGALTLFRHFAEAERLLEGRRVSETRGGGVGGATTSKIATLRSVKIAGWELHGVPATVHGEDVRGAFDTKRRDGNLGAGILARFRAVFDYSRDALWLEPGPRLDAPFARDRTGLVPEWKDGALVVVFVAPGSPAEAAGWKTGEKIASLDGAPAGEDFGRVFASWAEAPAGREVRFTMADGSERRLLLADYF